MSIHRYTFRDLKSVGLIALITQGRELAAGPDGRVHDVTKCATAGCNPLAVLAPFTATSDKPAMAYRPAVCMNGSLAGWYTFELEERAYLDAVQELGHVRTWLTPPAGGTLELKRVLSAAAALGGVLVLLARLDSRAARSGYDLQRAALSAASAKLRKQTNVLREQFTLTAPLWSAAQAEAPQRYTLFTCATQQLDTTGGGRFGTSALARCALIAATQVAPVFVDGARSWVVGITADQRQARWWPEAEQRQLVRDLGPVTDPVTSAVWRTFTTIYGDSDGPTAEAALDAARTISR